MPRIRKNLTVSLARQSAWAGAAAITLTASRFALVAIIARRMSQAGFGQYVYGQWLVDLSFLLCSLGATGAVSRYLAEFRHEPGFLAVFVRGWLPLAVGLPWLAGALVVLGTWLSGMHLTGTALAMLSLWTVGTGLWAMQTAALTGLQRFELIFLANVIAALVVVAGALLLPLDRSDPGAIFGLMAVASILATGVGLSVTRSLAKGATAKVDPARWRSVRTYAFNIWVTALLWSLVWSRGEIPIVRGFLGDAGVAHYAAALTLLGGAVQGVMLAVSGVAPQLTRLWGEGRRIEAVTTARDMMDVQLLLCAGGALVLTCLGPELLTLAFGAAYRDAANSLALFGFALLSMAVSCQNYMLQIATDARYNRNVTLLGLVVLFGLSLLMIPRYGLIGAAFARSATLFVLAAITVFMVVRSWGRSSVTTANLLVVTVVMATTVVAVVLSAAGLSWRLLLLACALGIVAAALRDRHGRLLCHSVPRAVWSQLGGRSAPAGADVGTMEPR